MQVRVRVTKLTKVDDRQYRGGTYFVEEGVAEALVASGNAEIIQSVGDGGSAIKTTPQPPFPATATSHSKQQPEAKPAAAKKKKGAS